MAAVALVAVSVTGGTGIDDGAAAEPNEPMAYLGQLQNPSTNPASTLQLAAIDPVGRRLYGEYNFARPGGNAVEKYLAVYDLDAAVPSLIATKPYNYAKNTSTTHFTMALAPDRKRIYSLAQGLAVADSAIVAMDLESDSGQKTMWDMATRLPGFHGAGMTYSAEDDRLYVVGEMSATYFAQTPLHNAAKVTGIVPTVAAFDPGNGSLLWWRHVPECGMVLISQGRGATIARSSPAIAPTLVFACATSATGLGQGSDSYPGQAGVVELAITPTAGIAEAPLFDVRFHPISGSYFNGAQNGFAVYDYGSDRLFVQSLASRTPGAWVFDGRLGGWAGFITGALSTDNKGRPQNGNFWGGVHAGNGHYYMGGSVDGGDNGTILVADGRASPPQNGVLADTRFMPQGGFMLGDAATDRVFITRGNGKYVTVARDLTRSVDPLVRPDYDAQTDDVDEVPGTYVSFSGDGGGFGARIVAVGDTAGVIGRVPTASVPAATRGLLLARVPTANVQPAGASSSAQAASIDPLTGQALANATTDIASHETAGQVVTQRGVEWPYDPRTCLDGGGEATSGSVETAGGRAEVRCTLATYESTGAARQSGVNTGTVAVGDTRVDTKVKRTAKGGMTTTTTSSTTGVRVEVPGVGSLDIGKVEAVAVTSAHGRSGTGSATWRRSVADVTVRDAAGAELFRTAGCSTTIAHDGRKRVVSGDGGACDALADTVRRLLQVRVRLLFPTADVAATPKGAFAFVGQTDSDATRETTVNDQGKVFEGDATTRRAVPGLQIDVYHDAVERSRYIVQLGGVESSAIYTVNKSMDDAPCDLGGCIPGGFDELPPTDEVVELDPSLGAVEVAAAADLPVTDASIPAAVGGARRRPSATVGPGLDGLVFARRSLGDGGLMAAFLLLVAGAVGAVARRRRLLSLLSGG